MASPLVRWLAGRSVDELAALLTRRPDVLGVAERADLGALAARLQGRDSVAAALAALPRPAVQVIEAVQSLGGPTAPLHRLADLLGRSTDDRELTATLDVLAGRALIWPDGAELRMVAPLWSAYPHPLGLGQPAEQLLAGLPRADLAAIARVLAERPAGGHHATLGTVRGILADADRVRSIIAAGPPRARALLERAARDQPAVSLAAGDDADRGAVDWALARGLLVADGWQHAQLPAEVGVALRGPQWRAPFDARPPELSLVPVDPAAVAREAVAAALDAVQVTAALVDHLEVTPVVLVKAGGVGSRELRRLARLLDRPEPEMRLWLELAYASGLIGLVDGQARPTVGYDEWLATEPPARLTTLLRAWTRLPAAPLTAAGAVAGPPGPALVPDNAGLVAAELRPALVQIIADLPTGRAVTDGLAAALAWQLPLLTGATASGKLTDGLWREAHLLGALAHGAATPLGRALTGEPAELAVAAGALVPAAVSTATFLTDLTAVVPGLAAAPLAALLEQSAVRESTGTAGTWRFTAASVRAALDAGWTTVDLLDALRAAADGELPQALSYLITDVGRQHGRIRVRTPGCVLRIDDPALGAELAGARALRRLGLVALAPTVLASDRPEVETLAALRAAGYLPVAEDAGGSTRIERPAPRRAPLSSRAAAAAARQRATRPDPRRLAELLLAEAPDPDEPEPPMGTVIRLPVPARPADPTGQRRTLADRHPAGDPRTARNRAAGDRPDGDGTAGDRAAWRPGDRPAVLTVADSGPVEAALTAVRRYAHRLRPAEQAALAAAAVRGTPVRIDYRDRSGEVTSRIIEPIDLDQWLLVAWCHLRGEERTFGLDRIEAVSPA